jgi:beta-mannanase
VACHGARDPARQGAAQPEYANAGIAAGEHDAYLATWARAVRAFGGPVYIRLAHEMNADWYPWSHEPREYRRMWRHVVTLFRAHGARNARFVFAPNPTRRRTRRAGARAGSSTGPGVASSTRSA